MITHNFNTLDLLTSPVWIVSPFEEQLIYANSAAKLLMQDLTFSQLRTGPYDPIPSPHKKNCRNTSPICKTNTILSKSSLFSVKKRKQH